MALTQEEGNYCFQLPPPVVIGPDEDGVRKVIEYRIEDGMVLKVTTTTRSRSKIAAKEHRRGPGSATPPTTTPPSAHVIRTQTWSPPRKSSLIALGLAAELQEAVQWRPCFLASEMVSWFAGPARVTTGRQGAHTETFIPSWKPWMSSQNPHVKEVAPLHTFLQS
ncbi:uncharacterized protein [Triticum aestivum]|uniref:uncharacterized protein n=1 Tax=Triticum aestivum TaxID=4565 RepID=UPI001D02DD32|nr:uncharacterized protein LOC123133790 [Triticum aestivum]